MTPSADFYTVIDTDCFYLPLIVFSCQVRRVQVVPYRTGNENGPKRFSSSQDIKLPQRGCSTFNFSSEHTFLYLSRCLQASFFAAFNSRKKENWLFIHKSPSAKTHLASFSISRQPFHLFLEEKAEGRVNVEFFLFHFNLCFLLGKNENIFFFFRTRFIYFNSITFFLARFFNTLYASLFRLGLTRAGDVFWLASRASCHSVK